MCCCTSSDKKSSGSGPNAATPPGGTKVGCQASDTKIKSGGVSGQVLDVTYEVKDCDCDSLQTIQVVWAAGGPMKVGKMQVKKGSETYDAFVDGGKNSPYVTSTGNPPAHPSKPYYLTSSEVSNQVSYDKSKGTGTIQIYDAPSAVNSWDKVFFETAIVCVNHNKSGKDKILKVFKWGWTGKGTKYQTSDGASAKNSGFEEYDHVSQEFKDVVSNDYPGYSYD